MNCECCKNTIHLAAKDVFIVKQADTMDATAVAGDIRQGVTAYSKNVKLDGAMPNNEPEDAVLDFIDDVYTIPVGYHDGTGTVALAPWEKEKIVSGNIAENVVLFGVPGELPLTDDATAVEASVLAAETFYAGGSKRYGAMPNNGATALTISDKNDVLTIPEGYHNGNGTVSISAAEIEKIVPGNILKDVVILGTRGEVVRKTNDRLADYINGTLQDIDLSGDEIGDIRDYMFYNNTMIRSVEFPIGTTSIGAYAFNGCSNLVSIILPCSLDIIGTAAFGDCIRLTSIDLPEGVEYIGSSAFRNTGISKIWIPESVTTISAPSRDNSPFYNCSSLTDIYCEASYQPAGFSNYWNFTGSSTRATVHWGVSREEYEEL